jgi:hypothetical protein
LRFLFASYPDLMGKVLGIVYRTLATHIIHKAGFSKSSAHTGAVTLIQRFAAILNVPQNLGQAKPMARKGAGSSSQMLPLELHGE